MISQGERSFRTVPAMCGGRGRVEIEQLLGAAELDGQCGLYARVCIPKGSSLGYHVHHGETETYYILSGTGVYDDNGEASLSVRAGDVLFCRDGHGHGLENTGDEDVVFMALIIKKATQAQ